MRKIKKKIKVREVECTVYNRESKKEETIKAKIPEFMDTPILEENQVFIDQKTIEEKEVVYTMKPETFIKHATIEE